MVGLRDGSLRACSSALSHSINAGIGVEPVLSCVNVGGDVPDELDEQEVVDQPGKTTATGVAHTLEAASRTRRNKARVMVK